MINKDIKNIHFRNNGASALYCGSTLIWETQSKEQDPDHYIPKYNFCGKFTDDSTEEDWWYYRNGSSKSSNKISIADKVNPQTKIFDFEIEAPSTLQYLFYRNEKIEKIFSLPSINVTNMSRLFYSCNKIETVYFKNLNCENITDMSDLFYGCVNITNVIGSIQNIKVDIKLGNTITGKDYYSPTYGVFLTNDSVMVFINGLAEVEDVKTIQLNQTTYDTLTEEQIALATSKGWSVIRS